MKKTLFFTTLLLVGITGSAFAQATPGITGTQVEQQARIRQGVATGELTPKETRKLERQQRRINQHKKVAKADGVVTPQERRSIKRQQERADRKIYNQKHDAQTR